MSFSLQDVKMYITEAYDDALRQILKNGVRKVNRIGFDMLALFGIQSRYKIDECFPITTCRKVWPDAVFAELIWFLSGSTNNQDLVDLGAKFWTPWVDRKFEEEHGFEEGDFGPVYGFQLRHFGADYLELKSLKKKIAAKNKELAELVAVEEKYDWTSSSSFDHQCVLPSTTTMSGLTKLKEEYARKGGVDQLTAMVERLKTNPDCRRNLFSLWNPKDIGSMRLPPRHYTFQVFTHEDKISGMLTQRSCDFHVGVPANVQFYSALIYMLGQQTGFKPHEFVHSTVDNHIYVNQIDAIEEYLSRKKPDSPKLNLKPAEDIFSYKPDNFELF